MDRACDHITAICTRSSSRAGRPRARPHGRASGVAPTARIQGRRIRCRAGTVRRLLGRPRHVSVPRGRQSRVSTIPPTAPHAGLFRGFILRNSDVGAAALSLDMFLFRAVCGNHIIWGFQHVAGFRRRHVGASIQDEWTTSLDGVREALDADSADDRTCSCGPLPRSSEPRATRCLTRSLSDSICRRSRPPRRTHWRKRTRRIPVPSGATCKD